ncbi:MAG: DUF1501 domain-containing protein, partial [Gemmataceae bacterium]|nr:DUF1501 domain-containing protein [Gemmataceae bacterium]
MISLFGNPFRRGERWTRREIMRIGSAGALGLSLSQILGTRPLHASEALASGPRPSTAGSFGKARSCIVLFLMGGSAQHSTWDPKPDAPPEIRGEFGPMA